MGVPADAFPSVWDPTGRGDGSITHFYNLAEAEGAIRPADCVCNGTALGCTFATAAVEAWDEAAAEARSFVLPGAFAPCMRSCPDRIPPCCSDLLEMSVYMALLCQGRESRVHLWPCKPMSCRTCKPHMSQVHAWGRPPG